MSKNPFLVPGSRVGSRPAAPRPRVVKGSSNPLVAPRVSTGGLGPQPSNAPRSRSNSGGRVVPMNHPSVQPAMLGGVNGGQVTRSLLVKASQQGNPGGSIAQRALGDVVSVATGTPNAIAFIGKDVVGGAAAGTYADIAKVTHIPLPGASGARAFSGRAFAKQKVAASAISHDYHTRWGPGLSAIKDVVTGQNDRISHDVHAFNKQLRLHPGLAALDVGSAVAGVGAGTAAALRAVGELAPETRLGATAARAGSRSISPGGARYLEPTRITRPTGGNALDEFTAEVSHGPLTPNTLTRPIHRFIRGTVAPKLRQEIGQYGDRSAGLSVNGGEVMTGERVTSNRIGNAIANHFGPQGQYKRAIRSAAQDLKFHYGDTAAQGTGFLAENYAKAIKGLRSTIGKNLQGNRHEESALFYHMQDLFTVGGRTPAEARASLVRTMREHIAANPTAKNANSLKQVADLEAIPAHMLDLSTAPERLVRAVREGKALNRASTEISVASKRITPAAAAGMATRPGEVMHGGSRYDPNLVPPGVPEVLAARQGLVVAKGNLRTVRAQMAQIRGLVPRVRTTAAGEVRVIRGPLVQAGIRIGRGGERIRVTRARPALAVDAAREALTKAEERAARIRTKYGSKGPEHDLAMSEVAAKRAALERAYETPNAANPALGVERQPVMPRSAADFPFRARTKLSAEPVPRSGPSSSRAGAFGRLLEAQGNRYLRRVTPNAPGRAQVALFNQGFRQGTKFGKAAQRALRGRTVNARLRALGTAAEAQGTRYMFRVTPRPVQSVAKDVSLGRRVGRDEEALARTGDVARDVRLERPMPSNLGGDFSHAQGVRFEVPFAPRGAGPRGLRRSGYEQVLRGEGEVYAARQLPNPTSQDLFGAKNAAVEARANLNREEAKVRGAFTPADPYTHTGGDGTYVPHIAVDKLKPLVATGGRVGGRITQEPIHQRTYSLLLSGNVSTDARLPIYAASKAVAHSLHGQFVDDFVQKFASRMGGPKGEIAVGPAALRRLEVDPEHSVAISVSALKNALQHGEDLPHGEFLTESDLGRVFADGRQFKTAQEVADHIGTDVVVVPREAAEVLRGSMSAPGEFVQKLDSVLNAWRGGILAFSPRWYVNNIFGNTLQYGLLAGPDVKSIVQANRPEFRSAIPDRVAASTVARDARGNTIRIGDQSTAVGHAMDVGYEINQHMEAFIRRGAYLAAAKGVLKREGTKVNRLTDQQLAHAVEFAPEHLKAEMIRQTELFLGDYRRMSPFEQNVLRRIMPFYSWIRVITKLTASLPFRHPLRAQGLAILAQMGTYAENPGDFMRPWYERGRWNLPGGMAIRTSSINPFGTVAGLAVGAGTPQGLIGGVNELATGSANPLVGMAAQTLAGRNLFTGRDVTAPPGFSGYQNGQFGRQPGFLNAVSGLPDSSPVTVPWSTAVTEAIPLMSNVRALVSMGRTPYDVVSTTDLIRGALGIGKPESQLYMPPPKNQRGTQKIPVASAVGGVLGLPVVRVNQAADVQGYGRGFQYLRDATRATSSQVRKRGG